MCREVGCSADTDKVPLHSHFLRISSEAGRDVESGSVALLTRLHMALLLRSSVLFTALLMLVSALPGELRVRRSPVSASEYGVKLCGREFIRAVIFACGGSRWKRLQQEDGRIPGYRSTDTLQDTAIQDPHQLKMQPLLGSRLEQLHRSNIPLRQQPLKDSLHSYDDYSYTPTEDFSEYVRQVEDTSESENSAAAGSDGFPWIKSSRRRRELSIGVAGICCKWGCTKAEISTLC
ncbi:relaxin-3-like [Rhinoderma darwinii]|uniref:relaxin-3-like n=1 Tax=Rhinoderma darwinii TaxID=43563 RepID=UPI003F678D8A